MDVPGLNFLMIDGEWDPNKQSYKDAIEALYSLAYTIKFNTNKSNISHDYVVMPLEGLWWAHDMNSFVNDNKDDWKWTAMIMQPDFVTKSIIKEAFAQVEKKKNPIALLKIKYESLQVGLSAQILHLGPYSKEGPTIKMLHKFIKDNGYKLTGKHQEIYLSDPRKTAANKLKTIIRQPMMK